MLSVLLESAGARGPRRTGWTVISVAAHVTLIASAIVVTTRAPADAASEVPAAEPPIFVPLEQKPRADVTRPTPREPGLPRVPRETVTLPPLLSIPTFDPKVPFSPTPVSAEEIFMHRNSRNDSISSGMTAGDVYTVASVERVAAPLQGNGQPEYPRALRNAGVEGEVVITFVVDATGGVERGSVTVVSATHELFADAVRRWLPHTRYAPAEINGKKVRQLVQQQLGFTLR